VKIAGEAINLSDLNFPLAKVNLILYKNKKKVKTYKYYIQDFKAKTTRKFRFNKLVPDFSDYKVEVEVEN
jgi:hypothetical protein